MNGKKNLNAFPDIAGNAMDYFLNRHISIFEKFAVIVVIMASVFIGSLPDMLPLIDEVMVMLLFKFGEVKIKYHITK